ncbi:MAG: DNA alkylation repair protein [Actinomycetota bacterium]
MAEPLKDRFGPDVPRRIAEAIVAVEPGFASRRFLADALEGYEDLELTPRARHIARALHAHLPADYDEAIGMLLASLGPRHDGDDLEGMAAFFYAPHVFFVAEYGLDHWDTSMRAQYELTQRFTAEYSIRAFLEREPGRTLARLREWARDPSPDVRRLVSEGTRPRLPWAPRLRRFQLDPSPVLELLELLKDDPSLYVRRSVANNLNDIGKDHPDVLVATCRRWMKGASEKRRWVIRHALRSAVKRGDPAALAVLGFGGAGAAEIDDVAIEPRRPRIGGSVRITLNVGNTGKGRAAFNVDLRVHFVKANGGTSPKVFKVREVELEPGERVRLSKVVSLRQQTTRTHHAGRHAVDVVVNGEAHPAGAFVVIR